MKIILGSQSPRRRELMGGLDVPFRAITIDADEHFPADLQGGDIPYYISRAKAEAYADQLGSDEILITADTIVWLPAADGKGMMLGKPADTEDAKRMLRLLSGRMHEVYTAVTFMRKNASGECGTETITDKTEVWFRQLGEDEIDYYVERYLPLDKAGAYGVQEYIGYIGVTKMVGSYYNVMGFPVERVYRRLKPLLD